MPTYITLINWTEQGVQNFEETVDRYEASEKAFQELGLSFEGVHWTLGRYDIVALVNAPDDETLTAALLQLGSMGNIRTETLRAFTRDEMRGIIEKAG